MDNKTECRLCQKICKDLRGLARHLQLLHKYNKEELKRYYDLYFRIDNEGYCLTCNKETEFKNLTHGYPRFCYNMSCISNHPEVKKKKESTCIEHFGETTSLKCEQVKKKIKETNIKKYGKENPSQCQEIKDKKLNTAISHFGCHQSQSDTIKEKKIRTSFLRYKTSHPMLNQIVRDRMISTLIKKYGTTKLYNVLKIKQNRIKNNIRKYGVEHSSNSSIVRQKMRISAIKRIEEQRLNNEPLCPRVGNNERLFLDKLQDHCTYKIVRNDHSFSNIIGRFPDGHIKECKLFIQFDELHHFKDRECIAYKDDDIQCTRDLESIIGYRVFRVSEKEWNENSESVIKNFKELTECQIKN